MEYERIHRAQTGIISPSKLRMLMGPHHQRKKDGSNSARTSPSKLEDSEFLNNSLLAPKFGDFEDEDVLSVKLPTEIGPGYNQENQAPGMPQDLAPLDNGDIGYTIPRPDTSNMSTIHPVRNLEDENLDYDSNASSSSFEFHKAERSLHISLKHSILRPMPSKWNNAEKWIMNRHHSGQGNSGSRNTGAPQGQGNRLALANLVRVAPESGNDSKRVDFCQPSSHMGMVEKFSFYPKTKDLKEVDSTDGVCTKSAAENSTALPALRSVAMRDMGTEMTPIPSQEPSRTATPLGSTTPLRSPSSSIPSSPRGGAPASTPVEHFTGCNPREDGRRELSEEELKEKTRKEIIALGVQLGKMNIAAWASKDEQEKNASSLEKANADELKRVENEKRAVAWDEAEKSKHLARYRREEIKIQAWESQVKAELEAEMRRVDAQVEQMRAQAHAKAVKKIAMARQSSAEKRVAAEARRNRQAERTTAQAEHIRRTGRIPSTKFVCCGWL